MRLTPTGPDPGLELGVVHIVGEEGRTSCSFLRHVGLLLGSRLRLGRELLYLRTVLR